MVFNVVCTSPALTRLHQCPAPDAARAAPAAPVVVVAPFETVDEAEEVEGGEAVELEHAARHRVEATSPASNQTTRNGVVVDMIRSPRCLPPVVSPTGQERLKSG